MSYIYLLYCLALTVRLTTRYLVLKLNNVIVWSWAENWLKGSLKAGVNNKCLKETNLADIREYVSAYALPFHFHFKQSTASNFSLIAT